MANITKKLIAALAVAAFTIVPFSSSAYGQPGEPAAEAMVTDTVIVRPLGIAASVIGTVFFIISLPFSIPGGNTQVACKKLIAEPLQYTWTRPLGEFN
jgi:hypothetical protein